MIHAFVSILVLTLSSAAFAGENCENLVLNCSATYRAVAFNRAEVTEAPTSTFADENWDEPSLANCAATLYFPEEGNTIIRVYATKDLHSDVVTVSADAGRTTDGPEGRSSERSNMIHSYASLGMIQNMGFLLLPKEIEMGGSKLKVKEVLVSCTASKAN